jgi:folate-binding protein YgfZ
MSIMETPRFAEILVHGSDAAAFLHSQLTSDVKTLAVDECQFSGYCGADGRVLALLLLARTGPEEFRLLLPEPLAQPVLQRLQRYRLRARCTLAASDVEIASAQAEAATATDARLWQHAGFCWRVQAGPSGPGGASLPAALWDQQVELGIPWLMPATSERFLPQMLGFDRLHAFSLRKGCYPGQEVIARTHYLGRSKRRLARVRAVGAVPAPAGSELAAGDNQAAAGTLVALDSRGNGLAVLLEAATAGALLGTSDTDNIATFVIESDVSETIGDISLNGRCAPPFSA